MAFKFLQSHERNIENIYKSCLQKTYNGYDSLCETVLEISGKPILEIKRINQLANKTFKTINNLTFDFVETIFAIKQNARV